MFQADDDGQSSGFKEMTMVDEENELAEIAQMIADESQELDGDEEDALETFETYLDVRKRLRDQKASRGFQNSRGGLDQGQWKLSGTVKGKLELLKARTTCHVCKSGIPITKNFQPVTRQIQNTLQLTKKFLAQEKRS